MRYPFWKYILIVVVLVISTLYALPNMYPDEPAIQITGAKAGATLSKDVIEQAKNALDAHQIKHHNEVVTADATALIRVNSNEDQLKAQDIIRQTLGGDYVVALNLAPTTPQWLRNINATPMKLGLDLRGGVHFLLEVDMNKALEQRLETATTDVKRALREAKLPVPNISQTNNGLSLLYANDADRSQCIDTLRRKFPEFMQTIVAKTDGAALELVYTPAKIQEITEYAVGQNLTTLRNRINELGVAEALVQTQGSNRIVVDLPGVQDTAAAKRVLGRTANLEFRIVADQPYSGGIVPAGTEVFPFKTMDGRPVLLKRQRIVTGERVQNAQSGFDENNQAEVNITLDSAGGKLMADATRTAVGKRMAVLFIESKQRISYATDPATGKTVETRTPYTEKVVINEATVQSVLGSQFRITGIDSPQEAAELSLLLRAGAMAAPMYFVEERTVGPSLGQENIDKGVTSTLVGFALVALFMLVFYRLFGIFANLALVINVAIILATMSAIDAALSLPGIAGVVLTIGIAVDANVLIFERIREELRDGASPKSAIIAGYDRAFSTIIDSHITTLLVALILFAVGTGPIKGFAVTLAIGIASSLFTSITVTRGLVQLTYGNKRNIKRLSI